MAEKKLYLTDPLVPGAGDLVYVSRADGSADGNVTFTALGPVFAGLLSSTFAAASHSHSAGDITGLATVATSGAYADLSGKPTLGALADNDTVAESEITLSDNTTNNVSTSKHGLAPKAPNDATKFLNGLGAWAVPSGSSGTVSSVGLSAPAMFSVSGSPVTTSGTLTFTLATQSANLVFAGPSSGSAAAPTFRSLVPADIPVVIQPQGRLTLVTGTPVLTSDQTAKTTVYYTPYVGNIVPLYDGTNTTPKVFSEISLALNSTDNTSTNLYDIFIFNNSGTLTLGTGPAWSSGTARGTGAGTTEIEMKNGVWTNKVSITLRAGGSSLGSVSANQATYLGTIYCTASGQTGMAFQPAAASGGSNTILGLFNAYNRVPISGMSRDSTGNWTYATSTWRPANNSSSNRVSYVDGLGVLTIRSRTTVLAETPSGSYGGVAVNRDSTSATPALSANYGPGTSQQIPAVAPFDFLPSLGFHYIQAMEIRAAGSGTLTFYGAGYQSVVVATEM